MLVNWRIAFLGNSATARQLYNLGESSLGVILVVSCLAGHLNGQTAISSPLPHPTFLNCNVCDAVVGNQFRDTTPNNGHALFHPRLAGKATIIGRASYQQDSPTNQNKTKKTEKQSKPSGTSNSPGHIFWVVPAFKVDYAKNFKPLTTKEKFHEWARGSYDPLGLGAVAFEAATLEHSSKDGFCGYGGGWTGYGKCYGSLELDANVSSFIGDFALAALLHQDPRYFPIGEGAFGRRLWHAVSRVFVTYNDSGHVVFYSSALSGTAIAAGISNLYYPQQDRTFGHTVSRAGIDLANTALYNAAAEFWPDIHRKLRHLF